MSTKREQLTADKRTILGKKIKNLRKEGILPANVFGKELKSTAVQLPLKTFTDMYHKVHETGLIDLTYGTETVPVLIHNVQVDPISKIPLHADFFKVDLKAKIEASIPIVASDEAEAETNKAGLLLQPMAELSIEALPTDLPEKIEVSVIGLANVGDQITVADLKVPSEVTVLTDAGEVVFKIDELVSKEAEADAAAAEAAAEEASADAEGESPAAEGAEAPAEGEEAKTEEKPAEEKPQE